MSIEALDHLYLETTSWDETIGFWEQRGFGLVEQWGSDGHRAGRLVAGSAVIVLAEVTATPDATVFLRVGPAGTGDPMEPTHWGTRMARVTDPDGRTFALETQA